MRCNNGSTGGKRLKRIDIEVEETTTSDESEFIRYKLRKTVTQILNDERKKSKDSIFEHVLFLLQTLHVPGISLQKTLMS